MYLYNRFKFIEKGSHIVDDKLKQIIGLVLEDFVTFRVTNQILCENSDNSSSIESVNLRFNIFTSRFMVDNDCNESILEEQRNLILSLFDSQIVSFKEYKNIRNSYIEEIVMIWKNFPNPYSKVYFEPECRYNDRKFFYNKDYSNIKIDVVHANKREKVFQMYECKTTMMHFKYSLKLPGNNRDKRKLNYLIAFDDICSDSDIQDSEFAFVTLALRNEFTSEELDQITPIYLITREDIELYYSQIISNKNTPLYINVT